MKDKVVVITGASSGIGEAISIECARLGAKLALASRSGKCNPALLRDHPHILNITTDVTNESDCMNLIRRTVDRFGRIDIMICNAGISMRALFEDVDLRVIHQLMNTNFWGTVYCSKFALPYLLESKGSLVGISSVAGYKGLPGRTGYSASKFAIHGLLEAIRIENRKKGLHVLVACPGFTASNIRNLALAKNGSPQGETPLDESRLMPAGVAARHIVQAIIKRRDRITLTTQGKLTVLLNKFFPVLMDRMVYNHMAKEPDSPFN